MGCKCAVLGQAHGYRMKLSVVVPAYNEAKLISRTLRSINRARQAMEALGWETELIVCDNNSTDNTADLARAEGARVVFEPVNQIARARNTGASEATGEWLLFIDADSYPTPELFVELAGILRHQKYIGGGCRVRMEGRIPWPWRMLIGGWNLLSSVTSWAAGSFVCCERQAFLQIGGFNNTLFAGEEVDFSMRLKKFGRQTGRRMFVITRYPLLTSSRKMTLYSTREFLRTFRRALLTHRRFQASREACHMWYDGRR